MFKKIILIALSALCVTVYAGDHAGVVKNTEGVVEVTHEGTTSVAQIGTKIYPGDVIKTSKNSNVGIMMKDDSRMSLGGNSRISLDRFSFNANTNEGNIAINMVKGTFAMISGLLVKHSPESATIKTPTSTAGIRGTYFVVEVP